MQGHYSKAFIPLIKLGRDVAPKLFQTDKTDSEFYYKLLSIKGNWIRVRTSVRSFCLLVANNDFLKGGGGE